MFQQTPDRRRPTLNRLGGVGRVLQNFANEHVSLRDFTSHKYVNNKVLEHAFSQLSEKGATLFVPPDQIPVIEADLTIPDNISLQGAKAPMGRNSPWISPLHEWDNRIIVFPTATIILSNASEIRRFGIIRNGLTMGITRSQVDSTFQGTAITFKDATADHQVEDLLILGFERAINTAASPTDISRIRIRRLAIDCQYGIRIEKSFDISEVFEVHCWPYVTQNSAPETGGIQFKRGGIGFEIVETDDWTKITNCTAYGYNRGFRSNGGNSHTYLGCGADNVPGSADGSIGFLLDGDANEIRLNACQTAGSPVGVVLSSSHAQGTASVIGSNHWGHDEMDMEVLDGMMLVSAGVFRGVSQVGTGIGVGEDAHGLICTNSQFYDHSAGIVRTGGSAPIDQDHNDFTLTATPTSGF